MDEQEFLKHIFSPGPTSSEILVGRGDDAAVVRFGEKALVLTTDSFIEGRHFDRSYFSPDEIGAKAVEGSVSDVIAMGGRPRFILWSLVFGNEEVTRELDFYRVLARGVEQACQRLGCQLVGGNLAKGKGTLELTMSVIGELPPSRPARCRSGAVPGEVLCVTGHLGASAAGLLALRNNWEGYEEVKRAHKKPRCRLDLVDKIGAHASSMIDISDGLSSELYYLSSASHVKLEVLESRIPVHPQVIRLGSERGIDPLSFVYGGGEEYELLFTLPEEKARLVPATIIGRVHEGEGVFVTSVSGDSRLLARAGFDHVSTTS
jgi:thiamine-monophosphate kinase